MGARASCIRVIEAPLSWPRRGGTGSTIPPPSRRAEGLSAQVPGVHVSVVAGERPIEPVVVVTDLITATG